MSSVTLVPVIFTEHETTNGKILAVACLNSPQTLNALTIEMIELMLGQFRLWLSCSDVVAIVIKGAGNKAFCAGGDVVSIYHDLVKLRKKGHNFDLDGNLSSDIVSDSLAKRFFTQEYKLDLLIHHATKPVITILDGYTMGGGVGLMAGASHRIATENTVLSMPEIAIGLYPDVGASWYLNQMPKGMGLFVGLTGCFINAQDGVAAGLVDYTIESNEVDSLLTELKVFSWHVLEADNKKLVSQYLNSVQLKQPKKIIGNLTNHQKLFDQIASLNNLEQCYRAIVDHQSQDAWFIKAKNKLKLGSPLSAFIIFQQLHNCQYLSLEQCFSKELALSLKFCQHSEFIEGVRALLVEKDNVAKWQYKNIVDVAKLQVEWFFT